MTGYARMTQHQAVGTSSAAVAGTGAAGCLSYGSAGAVDLAAAGAIAGTALITARFGAKATALFNPVQMGRAFAIFQIVVAPMVPLKGYLVRATKASTDSPTTESGEASPDAMSPRTTELLRLAAVGTAAGFASGMFGPRHA